MPAYAVAIHAFFGESATELSFEKGVRKKQQQQDPTSSGTHLLYPASTPSLPAQTHLYPPKPVYTQSLYPPISTKNPSKAI
jgi:hypothetical protein